MMFVLILGSPRRYNASTISFVERKIGCSVLWLHFYPWWFVHMNAIEWIFKTNQYPFNLLILGWPTVLGSATQVSDMLTWSHQLMILICWGTLDQSCPNKKFNDQLGQSGDSTYYSNVLLPCIKNEGYMKDPYGLAWDWTASFATRPSLWKCRRMMTLW